MFNLFAFVSALVVGIIGAAVVLRMMRTRPERNALGVGVVAAMGASALALLGVVALAGWDLFAVAHLAYLVATVAVPLAAFLVFVGRPHLARSVQVALVLAIALAPIGFYATHIEPFWLRVDHLTVAVASQSDAALRIGVLSDLQTESIGDYERRVVATLLEAEPDIVLIPGDLWQMPSEEFPQRLEEFSDLLETICDQVGHVVLVRGNTDRVAGLREIAAGTTAVVLDDEVLDVVVDGTPVRILGVSFAGDEATFEAARTEFASSASIEPIRIVLAHQPDEVYRLPADYPVDLLIAGHTHGGQVALPFFGPLVTLSSVPRPVAAGGLAQVNNHLVYVSTGVGRERGYAPQVRFGVRPSIGILDLVEGS